MSDVINGVSRELLERSAQMIQFYVEYLCATNSEESDIELAGECADQLLALLAAQPQAGADGSRKLSDLGNELHNLSCHVVHVNEGWAEQIGKIACELWKWPQASDEFPFAGFDPNFCPGSNPENPQTEEDKPEEASAAQSAPAGEREAFEAWHCEKFKTKWETGHPTRDMHNGVYDDKYGPEHQQNMWEAHQAGAAWQRTQSAANDSHDFKNFHRLLCERFGYTHDEKDWRRDQLSLIEWIAKQSAGVPDDHTEQALAMVPDGWRLVPVEPTPEMMKAGCAVPLNKAARHNSCYRAMLAAAPAQPAAQEGESK